MRRNEKTEISAHNGQGVPIWKRLLRATASRRFSTPIRTVSSRALKKKKKLEQRQKSFVCRIMRKYNKGEKRWLKQ